MLYGPVNYCCCGGQLYLVWHHKGSYLYSGHSVHITGTYCVTDFGCAGICKFLAMESIFRRICGCQNWNTCMYFI